ncbi:DUF2125 domain-containing protein [Pukyongiella litopenaei]|uniref:DUF2125 domain-containing protein n=1 Tax=Pukyongiella litopenaei TaxID=2605946 RepID=A0A2S0MNF3_9RHOB|nr:DUF2125 domain-containing protein [Pukyongiella litopenaei]AVO37419.1 DUF2125 domain-containing protein [Pukyongiella litopenaei]
MTMTAIRGARAALFLALVAQGAQADITAQALWDDWRAYLENLGYAVAGTATASGSSLTVSDMTVSMPVPDADGQVSVAVPELVLTERGDGTVAVSVPEDMPVQVEGTGTDGESFAAVIGYRHTGLDMVVSGSIDDATYDYRIARVEMSLDQVTVDGEPMPGDAIKANVVLEESQGTTRMTRADLRSAEQSLTAARISFDLAFADPDSDESGAWAGQVEDVKFEGVSSLPLAFDPADSAAMFRNGFAFDGGFTYGATESNLSVTAEEGSFAVENSAAGGTFRAAMSQDGLLYDVEQTATKAEVTSGELPFPLVAELAKAGFRLKSPMVKSDDAQGFELSVMLDQVTASDMIWAMVDPAAKLPRDPVSLVVDLSGKMRMLIDFFDPAIAEKVQSAGQPPAEVDEMAINRLHLSAAGAQIDGTGAFTFDNSDLLTYEGIPRPEGRAEVTLRGGNGLLDRLIEMGLVSGEEALMARGMVGMFAQPVGTEPDTLKSEIELGDGGSVTVNGVRLK